MKKYEELATDYSEDSYIEDEVLDTIRDAYISGFLKAKEMIIQRVKQLELDIFFDLEEQLNEVGEEEI